jgi:hypothetical protein
MPYPVSNSRRVGLVALAAGALIAGWLLQESPPPPSVAGIAAAPPNSVPALAKRRAHQRAAIRHSLVPAEPAEALVSRSEVSHSSIPAPDDYTEAKNPLPLAEPPAGLSLLLKQFAEYPDPNSVPRILEQFRAWGRDAGEAAMTYALMTLAGQLRLDSAVAAWRGWAERDLTSAGKFVARLLTPGHDYIVYAAADDYARRDAATAMGWALKEVPAEYRPTASQHVIMAWLRQEPNAALNWTADYVRERERLTRADRKVLEESVFYLAGLDLESAAKWVLQLRAGGAFDTGINTLLDRWVDRDPAGAAAWANSLAGQLRPGAMDAGYALFAVRASETDRATGLAWAQLISSEELRADTLGKIQARLGR